MPSRGSKKSKASKGAKKKASGQCPVCLRAYNKTTRRPVRLHDATGRQPEHRACATCRAQIIARNVVPLCPLCRTRIRVAPLREMPRAPPSPIPDIPPLAPLIARQDPPVRIGPPGLLRQPGFSFMPDLDLDVNYDLRFVGSAP